MTVRQKLFEYLRPFTPCSLDQSSLIQTSLNAPSEAWCETGKPIIQQAGRIRSIHGWIGWCYWRSCPLKPLPCLYKHKTPGIAGTSHLEKRGSFRGSRDVDTPPSDFLRRTISNAQFLDLTELFIPSARHSPGPFSTGL